MRTSAALDVAIIGGGPAGIGACLELSKLSDLRSALFEGDRHLGGIPRNCHVFFGMRDQKRIMTGPAYARRLERLAEASRTEIHRSARVLDISPGREGKPHRIRVLSPKGLSELTSRYVLLSTGCFEGPRAARQIPGSRPAGVFTTGTLQQLILQRQWQPGKRAVIVGSEAVSFSCVFTLRQANVSIAAMTERESRIKTYALPARIMRAAVGFPIHCDTTVKRIIGDRRVEAVELERRSSGKRWRVPCDTVVITGSFRPVSALMENSEIELDPCTKGPVVDTNWMTSVSGIFAAGNILRGADMHDLCALEGKLAARSILNNLKTGGGLAQRGVRVSTRSPIRYAVPQRIIPDDARNPISPYFAPCPAVQVAKTMGRSAIEAWSGQSLIWSGAYKRMIANTRIPIPVERFDWKNVDARKGILLKLRSAT